MAETNVVKLTVPENVSLTIGRNDESIKLVEQIFGKKSNLAGQTYFAPEVTESNISAFMKWAGISDFVDVVAAAYKKIFQDIWTDCLADWTDEDTGKVDWDSFWTQIQSDWADFTAGVVKLSALEEQIGGLQDEMMALTESTSDEPDELVNLKLKLNEISAKIKPLKAKREEIKAKYAVRAEKRAAKKAAQEEAAKKAAGSSEKTVTETVVHHAHAK